MQKHHPKEHGIEKSTTGTRHKQRHSKSAEQDEDGDSDQLTIEQSFSRMMWDRSPREHERAVKAVTSFLVKAIISISAVEGDGFPKIILQMNPHLTYPTRTTLVEYSV